MNNALNVKLVGSQQNVPSTRHTVTSVFDETRKCFEELCGELVQIESKLAPVLEQENANLAGQSPNTPPQNIVDDMLSHRVQVENATARLRTLRNRILL